MEPEAYIFDFDGTLVDSMWVWDQVDREFLAKRSLSYNIEYAENIAVLGFEAGADYVIKRFGLEETPAEIIEEWEVIAADKYALEVKLKQDAATYLRALKEFGYPLAIATSLKRTLLEPALHNNGITELFETAVVCDEVGSGGKSTPMVYLEAARQLGVDPGKCVVFEDVVNAARSAKAAGMYVVGVWDEHKQQDSEELARISDRFIHEYGELIAEFPRIASA